MNTSLEVRFEVLGEPVAKARARVTKRGTYTPKKTEIAERAVAWSFQAASGRSGGSHLFSDDAEFGLDLIFHLKSRRRRDIDNLGKLVLDALNGVAWKDDSQVTYLRARKLWVDETPYTAIRVFRLKAAEDTAPPTASAGSGPDLPA